MFCPDCSRETRVRNTSRKVGEVVRYRRCGCGWRGRTVESLGGVEVSVKAVEAVKVLREALDEMSA